MSESEDKAFLRKTCCSLSDDIVSAALVCVTSAAAVIRVGGVSSSSNSDPCPCPQCIINQPICAAEFSSHSRRIFSSECDMRCYNKCYNRSDGEYEDDSEYEGDGEYEGNSEYEGVKSVETFIT
uniref:Uncharacterized protein n=1 Tax=Timema cristinae TaxID=61476 RepID=A0A7R9HB57_TIMCR|nr:unnamed protein product [Timema cristinae]